MKLSFYKEILDNYHQLKKRNCLEDLVKLFPNVPRAALESIAFQECQRHIKKTYHFHASSSNVQQYYNRYLEERQKTPQQFNILMNIANEIDICPALLARLILDYSRSKSADSKEANNGKPKLKVNDLLKNCTLIDDAHLANEVRFCVLHDEYYGPISDAIRNSVGLEYENKLKNELSKMGLTFLDEKQLREKGYDKTPDVKLDIPIAINDHIVNWIESKASFGDEERHREYLRDQYWSYCNRFGPGLVIYWAGYIDELNTNKEQGILICDKLPTDFKQMDPSMITKKTSI